MVCVDRQERQEAAARQDDLATQQHAKVNKSRNAYFLFSDASLAPSLYTQYQNMGFSFTR